MSLLDKLNEIIDDREDNYDNPLPNFLRISMAWILYKEDNTTFDPREVAFMMDLYKNAREQHTHNDDNLLDKIGYSISCYERIDEKMKELGYIGIEQFRVWKSFVDNGTMTTGAFLGILYDLLIFSKTKKDLKSNNAVLFDTFSAGSTVLTYNPVTGLYETK